MTSLYSKDFKLNSPARSSMLIFMQICHPKALHFTELTLIFISLSTYGHPWAGQELCTLM